MARSKKSIARYGVEIESMSQHFEADDLAQIHASLDGSGGRVRVFDRLRGSTFLEGSAEEVRTAVGTLNSLYAAAPYTINGTA